MALYRALTNLLTDYGYYVTANTTFSDGATSAPGVPQMATPNWGPAGVDCLDLRCLSEAFRARSLPARSNPDGCAAAESLLATVSIGWRNSTIPTYRRLGRTWSGQLDEHARSEPVVKDLACLNDL